MSKDNLIGFAVGDRASKTADGQNQPFVIQHIDVRPATLKKQDLTNWRNAHKAAIALIPRRVTLYDLYLDIVSTDGQVIAVWGKRVDAVTSAEWEFTDKDGQPVEEINQLIDCIGFDELLTCIMGAKLWGYSMAEASFFVNDNNQNELSIYDVEKKHLRPELGVIAKDQYSNNGIYVREGIYAKTIMEFGKENDLGLLLSASMYAILKRGNISDWAEFIEIFGRGIIDATWDGFDEAQRAALNKAFEEMGGSGIVIRPSGTEIKIHQNTGNANGQLQESFADKMDAYISKVLLGSTETTDSSKRSGYAQAEIHQEQDEKKNNSDLNYVRRYLNSRFIKVLKAAGFDTKGGTFVLKQKRSINKEAFEIHKSMRKELGVPIDDDFFYEEYGVRKPDNYEELKKAADEVKNKDFPENTPEENADTPQASTKEKDKKPIETKEEKTQKLGLLRRVLRLFQPAPALAVGAAMMAGCGNHHTNKIELNSFVADKVFERQKDDLIKAAWNAKGELQFDAQLFYYTATTLNSAFIDGWRKTPVKLVDIGFDYGFDDPAILTAYEMNLFRFAGVKTLYEAQQLNELFRKSKTFKEFYDTASSMLTVHNRSWLETEYNTANSAGESAATYARLVKQTDLFPYWEYKTVGDEKVRHSHQLLDGIILPWNSKYWAYIFPPNDWNCRCWIAPRTKAEVSKEKLKESEERVKAYLGSEAYKKSAKAGWGINRANKAQVFAENQHYTRDFLDAMQRLNKLDFKNYKLEELKRLIESGNLNELKPSFATDQRDDAVKHFFESIEQSSAKKFLLHDFGNRQIAISKATVNNHTNQNVPKYVDRHLLLEILPDVLRTPDEVWLNAYAKKGQLNNYTYIKYYNGKAVAVITRLRDDLQLEVETWYYLDNEELRSGLLIKN